jgi:hypothetical protein
MVWYNYTEDERIKNVYCNYTIQNFWDYWSNKENRVMEVRIKDFKLIKEIAKKYNLPYSSSGIYVWLYEQLKIVIKSIREKNVTAWYSVNSKRKNWNKWGNKSFTGEDCCIKQIDYLFIDVDRIEKNGVATKEQLSNCDKLSNLIIERMCIEKWNNNYIKVCSGNGVQLLFKLDISIRLPELEYKVENKIGHYIYNEEFEKIKKIILQGIGSDIVKFSSKYKQELNVEVDKSCFNIGRVASLPFTKNYKYGGFTWRGIIEIVDKGSNEGLTDYIMSKIEDVKQYESKNVFNTKSILSNYRLKAGRLRENMLIKFMLENDLPKGMRNNFLWFQLKCLIRDSKIDINSEEFRQIHKEFENKTNDTFALNIPGDKFMFDENIVNKYFFENLIPPIYPVYPMRTKRIDYKLEQLKWEDIDKYNTLSYIGQGVELNEDIIFFSKQLKEDDFSNVEKYAQFLIYCKNKYGENITKYYFDYVMIKLLSYK